jgi:hypothetical protein
VSNVGEIRWEDVDGDCCAPCVGKVTELTLEYGGESAAVVRVDTRSGSTVFEDVVMPGEELTFIGDDSKGTLGPEIDLYIDGGKNASMHTSCSQPIGPGLVAGEFTVVSGTSRIGGPLCPWEGDPDPNFCANGKPAFLSMTYTGDDCSASSHSQSKKSVTCSGDPDDEATVHVVARTRQGAVYFAGDVDLGGSFDLDSGALGLSRLTAETVVEIWTEDESTLLQTVGFHTSCSQPLAIGDQFGSVRLDAFVLE